MTKPLTTETYTPDFDDGLKYINICIHNKKLNPKARKEVTGDIIFWSIFLLMRHKKYTKIFWKFIGINKHKILNTFYKEHIDGHFEEQKKWSKVTTKHFSSTIQQSFQKLASNWMDKMGIMSLLFVAMNNLSPQLQKYLWEHKIDIQTLVNNLENIASNQALTNIGIFAFLKSFRKILSELHLDVKNLEMIQMADADNLQMIMNSFESDVMDQGEGQQASTTTKDEDGEHKLTIEHFGIDLTDEAKKKHLDPCIGRDKEIEQLQYTLLRKTKNNPLLIGEAGVGKTAIVEGFAHRINQGNVPEKLKNKKIYMLDMGTLVAGTKYRGEFEARFKAIMEEAQDITNNIILFIDELHTVIGAGSGDKTNDAAQLLKPMLARGKIKLIGATTFDEYQKHIESDAALKRRFQEVHVEEPTPEVTEKILLGLKQHYEDFHGVKITDEAISEAIKLSTRYILNKHLPDKAIDIIDEASARQSTKAGKLENDTEYKDNIKKLEKLEKKLEQVIQNQDYFAAAEIKKEQDTIKKELQHISTGKNLPMHMRPIVEKSDIGKVLSDKIGIPTDVVSESEVHKLTRLNSDLKEKIIGQDEAVEAVVKTLQRSRLSVIERKKPIASFLFLGPSGVGKTYLAKTIAKDYFSDEKALIRIDMSEYMERYSVSKLIGSAPGYVGFEWGGMLTEAVRRKPYSVLLLDEVEKASPDVLNILLQILDEGQLKDSKGRWINFKNTIIIMTSNLGHEEFGKKVHKIGFDTPTDISAEEQNFGELKERVMEHVKQFLTPELRNRIDYSIIFKPLSKDKLKEIMKLKLDEFLWAWKSHNAGFKLPKFTDKKITAIIDEVYNPQFNARPLDKYIQDKIEPELIQKVIEQAQKTA